VFSAQLMQAGEAVDGDWRPPAKAIALAIAGRQFQP